MSDISARERVQIVHARELPPQQPLTESDAHRVHQSPPLDYGLEARSGNLARAALFFAPFASVHGATFKRTGWHSHDCALQLAFVMQGSIDIVFSEGGPQRVMAGDIIAIVGGVAHDAVNPSADYCVLELTAPAGFATTACEAWAAGALSHGRVLKRVQEPESEWVVRREHLPPSTPRGFKLEWLRGSSDGAAFEPPTDACRVLLVIQGRCDVSLADASSGQTLQSFDLAVMPPRARAFYKTSVDFEGVRLTLPDVIQKTNQ